MNNNTTAQPSGKHLLDIIAERLGCAYLSDLKQPQYRERARRELRNGDFDSIEVNEYKDAYWYLAPPLKLLFYGTTEDKALFESWPPGAGIFFGEIALYHNFDTFLSALCSDTYDVAVCMMDGDAGLEAIRAAHEHRPGIPMMWFPKGDLHIREGFRYDCVFCCMQHQTESKNLEWAFKQCREKIMQVRREKRWAESEQHNNPVNESQGE